MVLRIFPIPSTYPLPPSPSLPLSLSLPSLSSYTVENRASTDAIDHCYTGPCPMHIPVEWIPWIWKRHYLYVDKATTIRMEGTLITGFAQFMSIEQLPSTTVELNYAPTERQASIKRRRALINAVNRVCTELVNRLPVRCPDRTTEYRFGLITTDFKLCLEIKPPPSPAKTIRFNPIIISSLFPIPNNL